MSKLLPFFMLFLSLHVTAQFKFPEQEGAIMYTEVVQLDSTYKRDALFTAAKKWFAFEYKSANDVIQMQDKEAGELVGKGMFKVFYKIPLNQSQMVNVFHTIAIYVKDGKYKYEISNLNTSMNGDLNTSPLTNTPFEPKASWKKKEFQENYEHLKKDIDKRILILIESLKSAMSKAGTEKESW